MKYDDVACAYARNRAVHPGVLAALAAGLDQSHRLLEVGCGSGNYLRELAAQTRCTAFGCDPSASMLSEARVRERSLNWVQARAESLPFAAGAFDRVVSIDVIHHVTDRPAYFFEARRILARDGVVATVTDSHEQIARREPLANFFPETIAVDRGRYPTISTLWSELTAAGFRDVREESIELEYPLMEIQPYRERAFSCLHAIGDDAWRRGLDRLEIARSTGPVPARSLYTIVWAR